MPIRRRPDDFLVEELAEPAFTDSIAADAPAPGAGRALHAVYLLTKTSLTTPDAIAALARALRTRPDHIDFAGLKDRHARTTQHVSIPLARLPRAAAPANVGGKNWSARRLGVSPTPVASSSIRANRFTITVRSLSAAAIDEMARRPWLLSSPSRVPWHPPKAVATTTQPRPREDSASTLDETRTLLILNYFGDQRFGSARHGQGFIARRLIDGDFEGALRLAIATPARADRGATLASRRLAAEKWGDWATLARRLPRTPERAAVEALARGADFRAAITALPYFLQSMCVEAYQSHIWNDATRRIAEQIAREASAHASGADDSPLLRTQGLYAPMLFPTASMVDRADVARAVGGKWRGAVMPVPAPKTQLREPWAGAMSAALAAEDLTLADLRIPGLRRPFFGESPRPLFVEAANFTLAPTPDDDSARTVSFDLPRGAYATVVLRALGP